MFDGEGDKLRNKRIENHITVSVVIDMECGNPVTLARDLATLTKLGYKAEGFTPVDMFPHTEHVEAIVSLQREI